MELPLRITFRDLPHSDAIEAYVRQRASKLDTFSERITSCHVAIEEPHRHNHASRHFRIVVDLTLPGGVIVVSHAPGDSTASLDPYAAIDHAFDQVGRRLEEFVRKRRGDVKHHESPYRKGHVAKLRADEGYGFLETPEGDEVYFHQNSVLNRGFRRMTVGSKVQFVEELGDKGPQASTVTLVD